DTCRSRYPSGGFGHRNKRRGRHRRVGRDSRLSMHNRALVLVKRIVDIQLPACLAEGTELSRIQIPYDAEGAELGFYGTARLTCSASSAAGTRGARSQKSPRDGQERSPGSRGVSEAPPLGARVPGGRSGTPASASPSPGTAMALD